MDGITFTTLSEIAVKSTSRYGKAICEQYIACTPLELQKYGVLVLGY
jgi:hypothetical protein